MATNLSEEAEKGWEDFIRMLCAHVITAGGVGNPETFEKMTLKEAYTHLHPNDIILSFTNKRMKPQHQKYY